MGKLIDILLRATPLPIKIKDSIERFRKIRRIKKKIGHCYSNIRVIIGAGGIQQAGWLSTEEDELDILKERDWKRLFKPG